jgi:aldose 1-epimerase
MNGTSSTVESFGQTPTGRAATLYTLENESLRVSITDYGGCIVSLEAPRRDGAREHVALGFDQVADYIKAGQAFGALLGRSSSWVRNGCFILDGQRYDLVKNEGEHTLHGGIGFHEVFWAVSDFGAKHLVLSHVSADGDQGFPGELSVRATYRLDGATLWLELEAQTSKPTVANLSAHSYFNLATPGSGDVLDHEFKIAADTYLPIDVQQIPTGERLPVEGTPFDFRGATTAASRIRQPDPQLFYGRGYNHYFILDAGTNGEPHFAASAREPHGGLTLEVLTTQPGIMFYTANNLNGSIAGRDGIYRQCAGFCFEPQGFPNGPNEKDFPSTVLRPGEVYRESIGYAFRISEPDAP